MRIVKAFDIAGKTPNPTVLTSVPAFAEQINYLGSLDSRYLLVLTAHRNSEADWKLLNNESFIRALTDVILVDETPPFAAALKRNAQNVDLGAGSMPAASSLYLSMFFKAKAKSGPVNSNPGAPVFPNRDAETRPVLSDEAASFYATLITSICVSLQLCATDENPGLADLYIAGATFLSYKEAKARTAAFISEARLTLPTKETVAQSGLGEVRGNVVTMKQQQLRTLIAQTICSLITSLYAAVTTTRDLDVVLAALRSWIDDPVESSLYHLEDAKRNRITGNVSFILFASQDEFRNSASPTIDQLRAALAVVDKALAAASFMVRETPLSTAFDMYDVKVKGTYPAKLVSVTAGLKLPKQLGIQLAGYFTDPVGTYTTYVGVADDSQDASTVTAQTALTVQANELRNTTFNLWNENDGHGHVVVQGVPAIDLFGITLSFAERFVLVQDNDGHLYVVILVPQAYYYDVENPAQYVTSAHTGSFMAALYILARDRASSRPHVISGLPVTITETGASPRTATFPNGVLKSYKFGTQDVILAQIATGPSGRYVRNEPVGVDEKHLYIRWPNPQREAALIHATSILCDTPTTYYMYDTFIEMNLQLAMMNTRLWRNTFENVMRVRGGAEDVNVCNSDSALRQIALDTKHEGAAYQIIVDNKIRIPRYDMDEMNQTGIALTRLGVYVSRLGRFLKPLGIDPNAWLREAIEYYGLTKYNVVSPLGQALVARNRVKIEEMPV